MAVRKGGRDSEGRQLVQRLAGDADAFAARREDGQLRARGNKIGRELGDLLHEVLAVVEKQKQVLRAQVVDDRLEQRPAAVVAHAEAARNGRDHERRVDDWRQLHNPGAVPPLAREPTPDLQDHPRLAGASGPDDRHEPRSADESLQLGDLRFPTDE